MFDTVWVTNLSPKWGDSDIRRIFAKFGDIGHIERPSGSSGPKPYCFVRYPTSVQADRALKGANEIEVDGLVLYVRPRSGSRLRKIPPAPLPPSAIMRRIDDNRPPRRAYPECDPPRYDDCDRWPRRG
jgi:RNA recognition motif-containing protein